MNRIVPIFFVLILIITMSLSGCGNANDADASAPADQQELNGDNIASVESPSDVTVQRIRFSVDKMTCTACESAIKQAVARVPGVESCSASHTTGEVIVEAAGPVDADVLREAIERLGFVVVSTES